MNDDQVIEQSELLARGVPMATPVFDGAREADVIDLLNKAGLRNWSGGLVDGRTGEVFDRPVTVGYIYMLKLHHLATRKSMLVQLVHIIVNKQLLGGKAQFGGQRFGEMEVALKPMKLLILCRKC